MTPFQERVTFYIKRWEVDKKERLTGGKLARMLDKSRNLLSQMVNDGLVPSGDVLIELTHALDLNDEQTADLLFSAMQTKAQTRSRDTFWLKEALTVMNVFKTHSNTREEFMIEHGLFEVFKKWLEDKAKGKKKVAKKTAKKKKPGDNEKS